MEGNVVGTQIGLAATFVYVMQLVKSSSYFPWVHDESAKWLKRGISIATAFCIHTGISWVWNPLPAGHHQLIFDIPGFWAIVIALWHWAQQFIYQETIFQMTVNKVTLTSTPIGPVTSPKVDSGGSLVVPK